MVVMATFLRCFDSEGAKAAVSILPVVSRKQQPTRQTGGSFRSRGRMSQPASSRREQTRPGTRAKPLIPLARRDVRVVEGARLEIALSVCDGTLPISITIAKPTT